MTELITKLTINGYRGLSNLDINQFGKVNLITGRNNSGKSTILECIRLLVTGGSIQTFKEILDYREEFATESGSDGSSGEYGFSPLSSLFFGCPDVHSSGVNFSIDAVGKLPSRVSSLKAGIGWFVRKTDEQQQTISYEPVADLFDETADSFPAIDLAIAGRKRVIPLTRFMRRPLGRVEPDSLVVPCVYLDPFSSRSTYQLGVMWDAIALTDSEKDVVQALKVISDDIEGVSMIGTERVGRGRTAIARSRRFRSPIPLRTFGDGVNRLFGIVLSICNAKNGILLIDEIENGLHYSVQTAVWTMVFNLARSLNVQVFATTHSWDCVMGFQSAAEASAEEGVLIRIDRRGDAVVPTHFSEADLKIASRDQVEVR